MTFGGDKRDRTADLLNAMGFRQDLLCLKVIKYVHYVGEIVHYLL